ncbi:MAG: hypothetical protein ACYC4R_13340 [Anaerolineae bacterium]
MPIHRIPLHKLRALWVLVILVLAASLTHVPAWGAPVAAPDRQTVPLTPPATWTPRPAVPTATRTPRVPPTALPTLRPPTAQPATRVPTNVHPSATPMPTSTPQPVRITTAAPTAAVPATAPALSPTREGAIPLPWLALGGAPDVLMPGVPVEITVRVASVGNVPLEGAVLTLDGLAALGSINSTSSGGRTTMVGDRLTWALPPLPVASSLTLTLSGTAPQALLPEAQIILHAGLSWSGTPLKEELILAAPPVLLPDTGL